MQSFNLFMWTLVLISQTSALAISPFSHFISKFNGKESVQHYNNYNGSTIDTREQESGEHPFGEDDLFLSYFLNKTAIDTFNVDATVAAISDSAKKTNTTLEAREDDNRDYCELGKPGKVPLHKLPLCYQRCFIDDCCGKMMLGGPGDVRQLTTREFCDTKWIYVGDLILQHVGRCAVDHCRSDPSAREESNQWMLQVCGDHRHRGYPHMHPPPDSYEPNTC
ncbi:hypothetical protein SLS62_006691 [Diatrype stigma]|uniref:Uncharacterized protein n=1 Tax=Diatrype stigma TaxID=117547 RepID=A0AAN9USG6_9PEZI